MDAPGATEPTESARQAQLEQKAYVSQGTNESGEEHHRDDRPTPTEDGQGSHNGDEEDDHDDGDDDDEDEDEDSEEDEDDEEPRLKYAYLTKHLGSVYRNGDATSSFLTAGDKMV